MSARAQLWSLPVVSAGDIDEFSDKRRSDGVEAGRREVGPTVSDRISAVHGDFTFYARMELKLGPGLLGKLTNTSMTFSVRSQNNSSVKEFGGTQLAFQRERGTQSVLNNIQTSY